MKSLGILGLLILFLGLMSPLALGQRVADYNIVRDWSSEYNPYGVWTCGYKTDWHAPFTVDAVAGSGLSGISSWWPSIVGESPDINHNDTNKKVCGGTWCVPTNYISMHPGHNGELSVLRFTAPETGTYILRVWYEGLDWALPTSSTFAVVHDSNGYLLKTQVGNYHQRNTFSPRPMKLAKGETLDFMVGWGMDGKYFGDATGLAVRIWKHPKP